MYNNNCSFMGRFAKEPEVKVNPTSGKVVAKFTIAVDNGKDKDNNDRPPTYTSFVAYDKAGKAIGDYAKTGTLIGIRARYHNGNFEGEDGKKVYYHHFVVDEFRFYGDSKKNSQGQSEGQPQGQPNQNYPQGNGNNGYPQGNSYPQGNGGYPQGNAGSPYPQGNSYPQGNGGYQNDNSYPQGNWGTDGPPF